MKAGQTIPEIATARNVSLSTMSHSAQCLTQHNVSLREVNAAYLGAANSFLSQASSHPPVRRRLLCLAAQRLEVSVDDLKQSAEEISLAQAQQFHQC
jgi:hypothetical protein